MPQDNTSPLEGEALSLDQATDGLLGGIGEDAPETPATPATEAASDETADTKIDENEDAAATDEDEPSGEDEDDETTDEEEPDEDEDLPAIDPPASWKHADRDRFAELPRDLQQVVADRERSREVATNRTLQDAAEKRKSADAEIQAATDERQKYRQQLEYIVPALQGSLAQEFSDIKTSADVVALARDEPDRYALWRANQDALQIAQTEHNKVLEQQQIEQKQARQEYLVDASKRLVEAIPEWKDEARGHREIGETQKYLVDNYDLPRELLAQMTEPYQYQIARKAMLYDKAQRAKAKAVEKKVPKVQRPGTSASKADKAAEGRAAKLERLQKSGSIEDAVGLLMES